MRQIIQKDLNSRIVPNDEHVLLIFRNYNDLNRYKRIYGRDYRIILRTENEVDNGGLVGLRYHNWKYIDTDMLSIMIAGVIKR